MPTIYAFANQKGGVGKTTSAINIAAFLAVREKRTPCQVFSPAKSNKFFIDTNWVLRIIRVRLG